MNIGQFMIKITVKLKTGTIKAKASYHRLQLFHQPSQL